MFKNYLVLAFRNLLKRKLYSFINIFGLATGVAVCLVILKYVDFQLSYDDFQQNASSLYRTITTNFRNGERRGAVPLSGSAQGPSLLADIPEIKTYIRTHPMYGGAVMTYNPGNGQETLQFQEEKGIYVDSTFFDAFSYEAVKGNLSNALDNPNSIVLTETTAKRYFGNEQDILGKTLTISGGFGPGEYQVTAVIKDIPENTHLPFEMVMPLHNVLLSDQYQQDDGWGWQNFISYVQFHPNADLKAVEEKMPAWVEKYRGQDNAESGSKEVLTFQPIREIHLSPGLDNESSATMSMNTIYFFVIISIFILAIAWVNYINLSTARAMERAREVGIKKAVGAFRFQLITQFAFESVVVNFLATVLAVVLAVSLLPVLGAMVEKSFQFDFSDPRLWTVLIGLFAFGSFVSGAYPAFVLSSFNTSAVLKGGIEKSTDGFSLRKALVVFQFVSSLILIGGTFTIYRQIMFMRTQEKGLTTEQMLIINGPRILEQEGSQERLISFKEQIKTLATVESVTTSGSIPGGGFNWGTTMRKEGDPVEVEKSGNVTWVDTDFIKTYDLQLVAGKIWNPEIESDMRSTIVNEAALTAFGLGTAEEALGKRMLLGGDTYVTRWRYCFNHWCSQELSLEFFKDSTHSHPARTVKNLKEKYFNSCKCGRNSGDDQTS
jgi:putative ABC transport system permease protein